IYVSASLGNDTNSGLSQNAPVKTIGKAKSLLRDGFPDWMLLKRGDTFYSGFDQWSKSGRSSTEPMLVGTYGTGARPVMKTGANPGVFMITNPVNYIDFVGIHFYAQTRDPNSSEFTGIDGSGGFQWIAPTQGFLLEDCVFQDYKGGIVVEGPGTRTNVQLRRNIVIDSYTVNDTTTSQGNSEGIYVSNTNGIVLDGNIVDHNGWNEMVSGAGERVFNHNIYIYSDSANVVVKNNIISRGSNFGLQMRAGGDVVNNLFIDNADHLSYGLVN